jgi:hypothetical protein
VRRIIEGMIKMVRAKFIVDSKSTTRYGHGVVELSPVTSRSEENKHFWQYTPGGSIKLQITNPDALNDFEVGQEYYIDFTKAE